MALLCSPVLTMAGWKAGSSLDNAAFGGDVKDVAKSATGAGRGQGALTPPALAGGVNRSGI